MEQTPPHCMPSFNPQQIHVQFNSGITFSSQFDSGNLMKVEKLGDSHFNLWIAPDCYMTEKQNSYRTWFYFSVEGTSSYKQALSFTVKNMSFQSKLFRDGHKPVYRTVGQRQWERIKGPSIHEQNNNMFSNETGIEFSFMHEFYGTEKVYFAFCHPYSYKDCQEQLTVYEHLYSDNTEIYFHRNTITLTKENRRVDLLTISSFKHIQEQRFNRLQNLFPVPEENTPFLFGPQKRYVFLSARVHPGEVPGQHNLNGAIRTLLDGQNQKMKVLRDHFVFVIIPMINPDGVYRGHYRTDSWGQNLNRYYQKPSPIEHPPVYAIKEVITYIESFNKVYGYIDFHAHANRKGCFIYGNHSDFKSQIEICLFCRLISLNTPYFEYDLCNFTEKNMYSKDKSDNLSKEGSGRVALFKQFNIKLCYTVESSYNTGNIMNRMSPKNIKYDPSIDPNSYDPNIVANTMELNPQTMSQHYTIANYESIGEGILDSFLDINQLNPVSRVTHSPYKNYMTLKMKMAFNMMKVPPFRFDPYIRRLMRSFHGIPNPTKPCKILYNYVYNNMQEEPGQTLQSKNIKNPKYRQKQQVNYAKRFTNYGSSQRQIVNTSSNNLQQQEQTKSLKIMGEEPQTQTTEIEETKDNNYESDFEEENNLQQIQMSEIKMELDNSQLQKSNKFQGGLPFKKKLEKQLSSNKKKQDDEDDKRRKYIQEISNKYTNPVGSKQESPRVINYDVDFLKKDPTPVAPTYLPRKTAPKSYNNAIMGISKQKTFDQGVLQSRRRDFSANRYSHSGFDNDKPQNASEQVLKERIIQQQCGSQETIEHKCQQKNASFKQQQHKCEQFGQQQEQYVHNQEEKYNAQQQYSNLKKN